MNLQIGRYFLSPFLCNTDMILVLEHPWCQVFYRSHKHLKDKELVNLKNVHKILQIGHHYLEIYYLFENLYILWPHLENFSLKKMKLFIKYFLSIRNFANKFSSGSFRSCLFRIKFFKEIFLQIGECQQVSQNVLIQYHQHIFQILFDFAYSIFQVL